MKHVYKLIFLVTILTLVFRLSFGQVTHTIELKINPGTLRLEDPGTTEVYRGDWVIWKIKVDENIRSFNIKGLQHPFNTSPPDSRYYYYLIKRQVRSTAPYGEWKYNIGYKLKDLTTDEIDPKIAVKPRTYTFIDIALILGFFTTCITSLIFFRKWRIAVAKQKNNSH